MHCVALIVAAGSGQRFGDDRPKQYCQLGGKTVLARAIQQFSSHPGIDQIGVVIHADHRDFYDHSITGLDPLLPAITGGSNRQESVLKGLESLQSIRPDLVLVHDAARPLVNDAVIDRVMSALKTDAAVVPALPVVDTIKRVSGKFVEDDVPRDALVRMQTPQGFRYNEILAAHRRAAGGSMTDDAAVARLAGMKVTAVAGDEANFKITVGDDLFRAEQILATPYDFRSGQGFDVHALGAERDLMLCGINTAHHTGLLGHSDADVGLHALTDALLATICEGDIGAIFPPSDARWKDANSSLFLEEARARIANRRATIEHVDVTLICEEPKIGPHRDAMRARIAEILRICVDRVSVKATTTERLGFTGRGEGIAAQAIATIKIPCSFG